MIIDEMQIRPRYGEVDQMGYVYHANHVSYCHQARTELMRKLGICDSVVEKSSLLMPVVSFEINYMKPAHYDEVLTVKTTISELPRVKFNFEFEIYNQKQEKLNCAKSTIVFVDSQSRQPLPVPKFVNEVLQPFFIEQYEANCID